MAGKRNPYSRLRFEHQSRSRFLERLEEWLLAGNPPKQSVPLASYADWHKQLDRERRDAAFELAGMCRDYIGEQFTAWGLSRLSGPDGMSGVRDEAAAKFAEIEARVSVCFWHFGLRARVHRFWESPGHDWVWEVVVGDSKADYLGEFLLPWLEAQARQRGRRKSGTDSLARVEAWIRVVFVETGHPLNRLQVARLAGYSSLRELQAFQREDPELGETPRRKYEWVLGLEPEEAMRILDQFEAQDAIGARIQ